MLKFRWFGIALTLVLMMMFSNTSLSQSIDPSTARFVLFSEDSASNVSGSLTEGSVFADQQVVFEFIFSRGIRETVDVAVVALDVNNSNTPTVLSGNSISCRIGTSAADLSAAGGTCSGLSLTADQTLIRVSFNSSLLPLEDNRGLFDLFANVVEPGSINDGNPFGTNIAQTADNLLNLQVSGTIAVDVAIEGPVILDPEFPKQGERVTLTFFVTNNNFQNPGSINALDFDVRVPGASSFAPTTFLELNCFIDRVNCISLPVDIGPLERKRVQIQFITSQLPPTAEGATDLNEIYQLRARVNQASRSQEGGNETARNNNEFIVAFGIDQPVRDYDIILLSAPTRVTQGNVAEVSFGVTNRTSLVLDNNVLEFVLESQGVDPDTRQPLDFETVDTATFICDFNPPDLTGAFGDETCSAFDLFIAETRLFTLQVPTDGLTPDLLYRLTINLKALGESPGNGNTLIVLDEVFASQVIEFTVSSTGTTIPGGPPATDILSPELRPIELQIVPSATVEQGTSLVILTTIKNTGNRQADNLEVTITLEPEASDGTTETIQFTHFFPRLGIGLSLEVRQALETQDLAAGRYRVRVEVRMQDPQTPELDPNNNVLEAIVNIVPSQGENSNEGS